MTPLSTNVNNTDIITLPGVDKKLLVLFEDLHFNAFSLYVYSCKKTFENVLLLGSTHRPNVCICHIVSPVTKSMTLYSSFQVHICFYMQPVSLFFWA